MPQLTFVALHRRLCATKTSDPLQVQIIPWVISDSNYVKCAAPRLDPQKTVFVGALHGMMTAQGLAMIFQVKVCTISLHF